MAPALGMQAAGIGGGRPPPGVNAGFLPTPWLSQQSETIGEIGVTADGLRLWRDSSTGTDRDTSRRDQSLNDISVPKKLTGIASVRSHILTVMAPSRRLGHTHHLRL